MNDVKNKTIVLKIFDKIHYYWLRTRRSMTWTLGYRERDKGSLLSDMSREFNVVSFPKQWFAADPFLFEYNGCTYVFYELFIKKKNKGVIACSKIEKEGLSKPIIAIEEDFHLSFPCIFNCGKEIYMIPETGAERKIILYKCDAFPNLWHQEKVLLEDIDSSDSIIYKNKGKYYVLASILKNHTCIASNNLYEFDAEALSLNIIWEQKEYGNCGFRNAGNIFSASGKLYRPGQNCEDNDYGKGIIIWEVDEIGETGYSEKYCKSIFISDISLSSDKEYQGVHTYNSFDNYEVIDIRIIHNNLFITRLWLLFNNLFKAFFKKITG